MKTSLALMLLALSGSLGFAEDVFAPKVVQALRDATAQDKSGIAVLVARDGRVVYQGAFGWADVANKVPVTVDTKFRIGSITKQFTAAAILRLAEQGELSLADPLSKYYPGFPGGEAVTLRHLLTHTSGIHSYTEKPGFMERVTSPVEAAAVIDWFKNDPPDFAPGKGFRYDNSGYFLLGEIVAKVAGKPYAEFLQETFFIPLEMKSTGVYVNAHPPAGMALGYSLQDGRMVLAKDWDMSWAGGAGALYSTVGDLHRWNEALFDGRVVNSASFKAMTTPVELPADAEGMRYGFGLVMSSRNGVPVISHGGGLHGWSSNLFRAPEQKVTIVVLVNGMPPPRGLGPESVTTSFVNVVLADEMKKAPAVTEDTSIDPKTFAEYVGRYDMRFAVLTVTQEANALYVQLTGQSRFQAFPKAKDGFFLKVVDAEISFLRDEKGQVIAVKNLQGGQTVKGTRMPEPAVKLTTAQLEAFVGRYQYPNDAVMRVTREGMQLVAQLTDQPRLPIFPVSETEFEWHIVPARIVFVLEDGKVTKAVHTQNGHTFDAPRMN